MKTSGAEKKDKSASLPVIEPFLVDQSKARAFLDEVSELSGQNLFACYQCRRCAAGCTVGDEAHGVTPDRLIRMILLGDRKKAVNSELVWKCVSCYTCGTRCPNDIQTGRVTEALKKMAREARLVPQNPKVAYFHNSFIRGCQRWGRVNEMEFMSFYELKNILNDLNEFRFKPVYKEIKEQARLGLAMLKQGRLHFGLQTVRGRDEIKGFFKTAEKKKQSRKKGS